MSDSKKYSLKKIANSSWFITLVSTMFGIIVGLYLTNYNEQRKLAAEKAEAFHIVMDELEDNYHNLKKFNDSLQVYYDPFIYVMTYLMIEEEEIIIPNDSLDIFIEKTKKVFTYIDAEPHNAKELKVNGTLEIEFYSNILFADLSHIVWDTYKQGDFMSITAFSCLREIDKIYQYQATVDEINQRWSKKLLELQFEINTTILVSFINDWTLMLQKYKMLLEFYESRNATLENCK